MVADRNRLLSLFLLTYLVLFVSLGPWWHRATIFDQPGTVSQVSCGCCCHKAIEFGQEHDDQGGSVQSPPCDCSICKFFKQYQVTLENQENAVSVRNEDEKSWFVLENHPAILVSDSARGPLSRI